MPERLRSTLLFLSAPLAGALGGLLASLANWPLPWMTGSLLAVILLRCSGCLCSPPPGSRQTGQLIVACAIGLHITTPDIAQMLSHLGLIVLGACGTFLLSLIGINLLTRAGYDRATAYFASMPGGASEMAVIGARHSAGIANVVAAHSLRLLMVVLLIPALFTWSLPAVDAPAPLPTDLPTLAWLIPLGALLALLMRRLRQPNPWMLGPLIVCASAGVRNRPATRRQRRRPVADRQRAGLPLRPRLLPQGTGVSAARAVLYPAGDAGGSGRSAVARPTGQRRPHQPDARHDARRHHRAVPDR